MFLSRQVLSTRLQPGNYPAIIIGEVVELLAALDEVGIPVHEEYIYLAALCGNLPPGYEFIKRTTCKSRGDTNTRCAGRCTAEQVQRTIER